MKKLTFAIILVTVFASSALAATSSPCGYKKPAAPQVRDDGYRRDVLDFRVPVQTEQRGDVYRDQATKDRETLLTGKQ